MSSHDVIQEPKGLFVARQQSGTFCEKYVSFEKIHFTSRKLKVPKHVVDLFRFHNKNGYCFDPLVANTVVLITHHGVYN